MGFRIEAPKQDGNARFNTLKVNLNENNLATRVVVVDEQGNFYYGAGGAGSAGTNGSSGTSGVNGSSGTSGINGTSGTSGTNGSSGSSGTSGTGFNTIADPLQGRVLLSDGSTNNASASANIFYDTGSFTFQVTGSIVSTQGLTGSLEGTASWAINAQTASFVLNSISASYVSGSGAIVTNLTSSTDALINGLTIGKGGGNITNNTAIGDRALGNNASGIQNTAIGSFSLSSSIVGAGNTAVGFQSLQLNTSNNNTALGWRSLYVNTIGSSNVAVGTSALISNTSGSNNVAMGLQALLGSTTGNGNTAIGYRAGYGTGVNNNTTGTNNIFIGNISVGVTGSDSNRTWIGNTSTTSTWLGGNLILGQTSDFGSRLQVTGNATITGSLTVSQGITGSLFGTSSWAVSASWAPIQTTVDTASFVSSSNVFGPYGFNSIQTASYALTASSADDFTVRGTLTAQTIVTQVITSSTEYVTGSTIFGSQLSNTHEFTGSVSITGSLEVNDSVVVLSNQTGSMSVATSSYAFTASYVDSSNVDNLFRIATGSVSASVNVTPESLFLINSGFTQYFNISSSGDTDIYSNLFIVRNFNTQQPVLTISQSIVQIATQSIDPIGITQAGTIWFTSASMFVGLE